MYVDGFVFAFSRGNAAIVVLSGQTAKNHPEQLPRTVALNNLPPGMWGKTLHNIFNPNVRKRNCPSYLTARAVAYIGALTF